MKTKDQVKEAELEQKRYRQIEGSLRLLKANVENENLPMPLARADDITKAIDTLTELCSICVASLESHIDDLANEQEGI